MPNEFPSGVRYHPLNVLADAKSTAPAELEALLHEPEKANVVLGNGRVEALFIVGYRVIAEAVFGVKPEYLEASFDEMRKGRAGFRTPLASDSVSPGNSARCRRRCSSLAVGL
ncbi:MAG: hypothetical protein P4L90_12055 [Rhodopila sp.]|nr:hypothetical protein [Rhodopila sp.]